MKMGKIKLIPVVSIIVGVVFWIIGELLFDLLTERLFTPVGISLYFLLFSIILSAVLLIIGFFQVDLHESGNARNTKEAIRLGIILIVILFMLAGAFEFLYELGDQSLPEPTSFILLIDDSGSMSRNDSMNDRPNKIDEFMKASGDLPYAVYKFTSDAVLIKGMGMYTYDDISQMEFDSYGDTGIIKSINTVVDDYEQGVLSGGGEYPRIILFSDGGSSSFGMRRATKRCINDGITICSVGFGGCDERYLEKIANMTGGTYVYCDDVAGLDKSMKKVATAHLERNLLSVRSVIHKDWLYCILRLLFLSILGIIWSIIKNTVTQNIDEGTSNQLVKYIGCCLIGVLFVEFISNYLSMSVVRLVFCITWALAFGTLTPKTSGNGDPFPQIPTGAAQKGVSTGASDRYSDGIERSHGIKQIGYSLNNSKESESDGNQNHSPLLGGGNAINNQSFRKPSQGSLRPGSGNTSSTSRLGGIGNRTSGAFGGGTSNSAFDKNKAKKDDKK